MMAKGPIETPKEPLATYRAKRNFTKTPEPAPESSPTRAAKGKKSRKASLEFVVQKHDATRLHYDVRLEIAGAMMSWAVPKGPSYDPKVKRLAVETEDHPMAYNAFEGRIPDGEYGAGDVLIWDRGTYETVPPGQEEAMRAKGHVHARFFGEKLVGAWHFVKTRGERDASAKSAAKTWIMFKADDETADPARDITVESPHSVVSGRAATRGPERVGASAVGKSARALVEAMGEVAKATSAEHLDDPAGYWLEIKYDGYRILAGKAGGEVRLVTRNGNDYTAKFRAIADAVATLSAREAVLDGEACAVDQDGKPSFGLLQEWLGEARGKRGESDERERRGTKERPDKSEKREKREKSVTKDRASLVYAVFDLLWLDGRDLRELPIEQRRELLDALVKDAPAPISLSRMIEGDLAQILDVARTTGLEGLVAKRKGSRYVAGHSAAWKKIKFERRQDCAIAGYIPMKGTKGQVGALLLGVMDGSGSHASELRYAGRVGTGFDARTRKDLARRLDPTRTEEPRVTGAPKTKDAVWTEPTLVCEVAHAEWTRDGSMRHPRYVRLREDKDANECFVEGVSAGAGASAKLTNPTKILFPRDAITKRDIFDYYTAIASVMLPHLAARPLSLQRWPHGIDGESWFQQNAPEATPAFVKTLTLEGKRRIVAENVETLQWLANLAAITIHQWASHAPKLDKPDYTVIDLDPGDGTWKELVEVALAVRTLLDALELESVVKTSGKRGLHVVVPFAHGPSHEDATAFGEQIATAVAKVLPKIATVERMKNRRGGRLYIDYLQNGEGKTIVSPYTVRALDGATVSTPITWDEVTEKLDPTRFTIRTVLDRVAKKGDLFARALASSAKLPRVR